MTTTNYINHVAIVMDASSSMLRHRNSVVKVADNQIAYLAKRSQEMNQETRITVYVFASSVQCVIFDMDVLRLPSMSTVYNPWGNTALLSATKLSQEDLAKTFTKYGDHAFLTFVLTDGQENASHLLGADLRTNPAEVRNLLVGLPENYTVACLVPDQRGVYDAKAVGFPTDNIAVWDANSEEGVEEAGRKIREATDSYMTNRSLGVKGTRTLFSTGIDTVNKANVNSKTMVSLDRKEYMQLKVAKDETVLAIREWVRAQQLVFQTGKVFYELTKRESIQPQKALALQNIHSGRIYTGPQVRELLGLPDVEVRVSPDKNPEYRIFVQSTSVNRKLVPKTRVLILS